MTARTLTATEARRELYEIIRGEADFETKAADALELGRDYLDADHGFLTRIEQESDHWEILVSTDLGDGDFPPGMQLDLDTAYCKRTIAAESSVSFGDAAAEGLEDDPAFTTSGYHCYHGTRLIIDDEPFGTVCFLSEEPRAEGFSDGETMFAELVAQLLERDLERTTHEAEIRRQANLTTVLNRVLRHNLRNEMTVIRGRTEVMADQYGDTEHAPIILDRVDELIGLAETARSLERVVEASTSTRDLDLEGLVSDAIERIKPEYPDATFVFDCEPDLAVTAADNLELALAELVDNAAKHGGDAPTVEIRVTSDDDEVEIQVIDDGPGLSKQERDVLREGAETPLVHGSGLGLWLVNWVITGHDGTVDTAVSPEGTTMTVRLPRHRNAVGGIELTEVNRSRDQYRAAFENASDTMAIIDDEGRIIDANAAASELFGLDSDALLGRSLPEFLPEGFDFEDHWRNFQSTGVDRGTLTLVTADGTEREIDYAGSGDVVPGQHLFIARPSTD